jgi:NADH dehydrogenase FAD-containing subunit
LRQVSLSSNYLEVQGYEDSISALGDRGLIIDPNTGDPCPPTAQYALRQGEIAASDIFSKIIVESKHYHKKKRYLIIRQIWCNGSDRQEKWCGFLFHTLSIVLIFYFQYK